jgi:hypothetical protein
MERHDGDPELGRLLVDEPPARLLLGKQPVPRGADRFPVELGDHSSVSWSPPLSVVPLEHRVGERGDHPFARPVRVPRRGLVEHLLQELNVTGPGGPNVHAHRLRGRTGREP